MKLKLPKIRKVRLRITLYFTVLVVIVIFIINIFTGILFSNELVRQTEHMVHPKMTTIVRDIHGKISSVRALCTDIQNDGKILKLVMAKTDNNLFDNLTDRERKISYFIKQHTEDNKLVNEIVLVDAKSYIMDLNYSSKPYREIILNDEDFSAFIKSSYFEDFSLSKSLSVINNSPTELNSNDIYYFNKILDTGCNRLGSLVVSMDTDSLFEYTGVFCREIFDSAYIMNSKGELIFHEGPISYSEDIRKAGIEANSSEPSELKTINGEKYILFRKPLSYNTDWNLVGIISYEKLTKNVKVMSVFIYFIGIVCIIAVAAVSSYIAISITKPIIKINKAISRLDTGEWPEAVVVRSEDELKHLVDGINRMVKNLKQLFQKIYDEEESKKKAEIKALQFQLELLQSQINPHFIYNTLNTFSFLALKNGDEKLRELIQDFDKLLRSSISVESNFVTIEKELELTEKYLKIQECRYGNIFRLHCIVPEEIQQYKIPKLILQPLVENSLYHGIVPKDSFGLIKIEFTREDSAIKVKVIDDGVGLNKKDVQEIMNGKRSRYSKGFSNIGVTNINDRLKLYFGAGYSLKIYSSLGIGTTVEFSIPYLN